MTNEDYKYLLASAPTIFKLIGLLLQDSSIKYIHQYDDVPDLEESSGDGYMTWQRFFAEDLLDTCYYALDNMGLTDEDKEVIYKACKAILQNQWGKL